MDMGHICKMLAPDLRKMKLKPIVFILAFITISCSRISESNTEKIGGNQIYQSPQIEMIQIQFEPAFLCPAILTLNFKDEKILFQRVGRRNKLLIPPVDSGKAKEMFSPRTTYFKIDSLGFANLKDSVLSKFTNSELIDMKQDMMDGFWASVIFAYSDNSIKDFELNNSGSKKHYQLIVELLDFCIRNETDSLTKKYLIDMKAYY